MEFLLLLIILVIVFLEGVVFENRRVTKKFINRISKSTDYIDNKDIDETMEKILQLKNNELQKLIATVYMKTTIYTLTCSYIIMPEQCKKLNEELKREINNVFVGEIYGSNSDEYYIHLFTNYNECIDKYIKML